MTGWTTLTDAARTILGTADCIAKTRLTVEAVAAWRAGLLTPGPIGAPDRPARPVRPVLLAPRAMPRRRSAGGIGGRRALLHALAHIEVNALDLVWDLIARFPAPSGAYLDDWLVVAEEEARHFMLLTTALAAVDTAYGDLPAHDGLWEIAAATAHDLTARLALVPLVMEARGLDVTPQMIERLDRAGDAESADILRVIYADEIGHVATGRRWFERQCDLERADPGRRWTELVSAHFRGALKPPFNHAARAEAGLPRSWYEGATV